LYQPDQLPDLLEDQEFTSLKFEDRKKVFEKGVEESAAWVGRNGGWTPETFTDFRQSVRALRGKVTESESFGEKTMGAARTIGGVLKDSAAVLGTTAADLRFADAQDGEVKLRAPLSDVGPALMRNMDKLTDSVKTAHGKSRGGADEAIDAQLDALDAAIDKGEFLQTGDARAWFKAQGDAIEKPVRDYFTQQGVAFNEEDYLKGNRLDSPGNLPLVMRYIATANPDTRKALRENLLRLPNRAAMEDKDEAATQGSDTGKFLDDVFGEGASRYVSEAGDPLEVLGNVTAFLGGKALVSAGKAALQGAGVKALKTAGKAAAGVAGETVSEMGSLFMDNPNATAGDYAATAKDAAIGSLGLAGAGGAYQVVRDAVTAPVAAEALNPAAAAVLAAAGEAASGPTVLSVIADYEAQAGASTGTGGLIPPAQTPSLPPEGPAAPATGPLQGSPDAVTVPQQASATDTAAVSAEQVNTPPPQLPKQFEGAWDHGVALIKQGVTDFAQWSVAMVKQFGEAVKEYLQGVWDAAVKTSRVGAVQLGGTVVHEEVQESGAAPMAAAASQAPPAAVSLPPGERVPADGEATQKRSFGQRVAVDPRMHPKVQAQAVQEYAPIGNEVTLGQANAIIDERGLEGAAALVNDSSVPVPDHVRVALGMQVMLRADKAAREARNSGDLPLAAQLWQTVAKTHEVVDKLGTQAGRAVQAFSMWTRMTPEGILTAWDRKLKEVNGGTLPPLPPELVKDLGGLRDKINTLPEDSPARADLIREMLAEMARFEGIPIKDVLTSLWYANLLSGLTTQGMNIIGNGVGLMLRTAAASLVNHPRDTLKMLEGFLRGQGRAWTEARSAWQGKTVSRNQQDIPSVSKFVQQNALDVVTSRPPSDWKSWVAWLSGGWLLRYVGRFMTAMDAAAFYTASEGRAHLAASRAARKGFTPGTPEFVKAMADMLGRGEAAWAQALEDARLQLKGIGKPITKHDVRRIAYQIMDAQRPLELREETGRFGELVTAQQEPDGIGGWIYEGVKWAQRLPVLGRVFLPFARTLANLTSNALDFTPVGVLRGIKGKHLVNAKKEFESWERWERASAGTIGTAALTFVYLLAAQHADEDDETAPFMIYGFGPKDPQKRKMMPKGWKPFTIKIRGHYVSYAETPLVYALALAGSVLDAQRYGKDMNEKSLTDRAWYYGQSVLKASFSQGVLSSMADLFGAVNGDVAPQKLAARATSGFIPGQGFLRDVTALFDPVKISDDTIAASILRDVPVLRHVAGKPMLDYMGDPIMAEGLSRIPVVKRFVADQRTNDRDKTWVGQQRLSIPGFPKTIEVGQYLPKGESAAAKAARIDAKMLTDDEAHAFAKRAGQLTRAAVKQMRLSYEGSQRRGHGLPERAVIQKDIDRRVRVARTMAMRELMMR
jgi:hypothetical protein